MKKLLFALVVAVSLGLSAPAHAATSTTTAAPRVSVPSFSVTEGRHHKPPLSSIPPNYMASSWCGNFWRGPMWCINFSRSEQKWLVGLSATAAGAAICGSTGIGCVVAVTVAYALIRYVDGHGVCPIGKVLEVEYAPWPGGYASCSDG